MDYFHHILQTQPRNSSIAHSVIRMMETVRRMESADTSVDISTSSTMENTPTTRDTEETPEPQDTEAPFDDREKLQPTFLGIPVDIFRCIVDYLDRGDACTLKLVCRGLSDSEVVNELMYREPVQFDDVREIRMADWLYKPLGRQRWEAFRSSINDSNKSFVQSVALSHFCSIEDFKWVEQNLPKLTCLDIANIKDFVWTPGEVWTWKELLDACPLLFARLQELEVCNWADFAAHSRVEYNYSYNDYLFKSKFRISRRRDGSSIPTTILKACTQLKILGIRGCSRHIAWNEWEVHQRICTLVDGIVSNAPPMLQTLKLHEMAPFLSLMLSEVSRLRQLSTVSVGLCSWMQEHRDNFRNYPLLMHRMIPGTQHRDEEEAFDEGTLETCNRNHMQLGQQIVDGVSHSLSNMLKQLLSAVRQQTTVKIKSYDSLQNVILHPFHFINVHQPTRHQVENPDFSESREMQDAVRWMATTCGWKPVFTWDTMMCDVFPANIDTPTLRPKADILSQIRKTFEGLKALGIPLRLTIGDRILSCSNSGLDRSLYFGDFKTLTGDPPNHTQTLQKTQARFNLTGIAHLVDELIIHYSLDMPGVAGWGKTNRQLSDGEKALIVREMKGWRKFWARYALQFTNLKKLNVMVPKGIFDDWGRSKQLAQLLQDESWQALELDVRRAKYGSTPITPGLLLRHTDKKHPRMRFVKRVFFRQNDRKLRFDAPSLTEEQREEEDSFSDNAEEIADLTKEQVNRFWSFERKPEKRKLQDIVEVGLAKKGRVQ